MPTKLLLLVVFLLLAVSSSSQQGPALEVTTRQLIREYLSLGPDSSEIADSSAKNNWAMLEKIGIPELLQQASLKQGDWNEILAPLKAELDEQGFSALQPMDALAWRDETRTDQTQFLRLLAGSGLIDGRKPKSREKGKALWASLGKTMARLNELRANLRFERAKWNFTATASLVPSQRVVRVILRGSKLCPVFGRDKVVELALKGKFGLDTSLSKGVAVKLIEHKFSSLGCEQMMVSNLSSITPLAAGGEGRVSGRLALVIKDEAITGKLELDIASRALGQAMRLSHAVFAVRGDLASDGSAHAVLTSVSATGDPSTQNALAKAGVLEALFSSGQGVGLLRLPFFAKPLSWQAALKSAVSVGN